MLLPAVLLAVLLSWPLPGAGEVSVSNPSKPDMVVVYLVRHAERAAEPGDDPDLSQPGQVRAAELARTLADVPLASVHSTDYRRTLGTARPVSRQHGLEPNLYDPSPAGLRDLATRLADRPGHHLVVGHSNTTPQLVETLGGEPVSPIDEGEYDRLYLVTLSRDGSVISSLLRYGSRSGGKVDEAPGDAH
jgi:phosphohistidine phosphatase SixA